MEWTGLNELRERFLHFFEQKGHTVLASAPLVPRDDHSLLLINSGMAPLKKYFMGLESIPGNRAASCQKCIRTPDIERVGKTSRHGTYFEMLGNFSFGDYFKEQATEWAWEFITVELKIPVDKLWVTIYLDDDEAFDIWTKNRGVSPDRIVRLGKEDNFWEIGAGPCGPCSEIYFDRGEACGCGAPGCTAGCDCDRYVEFWNLVFTQFNSDGNGNYTPLEKPNIDTGMGLERLACIMQGVDNLFEVDTVQNIMQHIATIAGVTYKQNEKNDVSLRVITDHIRSTVFLVGDGVVPQNEGRGYVLRRLLRRAARHGRLLGITDPFLYKVCATVIEENRSAYPELAENADYIRKVIEVEEGRFARAIEQGMDLLGTVMDRLDALRADDRIITGQDVFRLYDTFGFPMDLTREIALDRGIRIDESGFLRLMEEQRRRAREARARLGDTSWEEDILADERPVGRFVGYDTMTATTTIESIVRDGEVRNEIAEGDQAILILRDTPFYAESGGQVADTGWINVGKSLFQVTDCKKSPTGYHMHFGRVHSGFFVIGDTCTAVVSSSRRRATMRNHTATHLLQAALRKVLGDHVHQAGSLVDPSVCRFDFTHFHAVTDEQLKEVEKLVNKYILQSHPVVAEEMSMEDAKKRGAMALFGDKYGDVVRVVTAGDVSVELCGGTHVQNTSQIGLFKILTETSVAAGVRRIEGVTGEGVMEYIDSQQTLLSNACAAMKITSPQELEAKATATMTQLRGLQKELDELNRQLAKDQLGTLEQSMVPVGNVKYIGGVLTGVAMDALLDTTDRIKDKYPDAAGFLVVPEGEKTSLLTFAGKSALQSGLHCGNWMKTVTAAVGGSGGGRPHTARGALPDASIAEKALAAALDTLKKQVNA
jgi:alanine--tRNA ligase